MWGDAGTIHSFLINVMCHQALKNYMCRGVFGFADNESDIIFSNDKTTLNSCLASYGHFPQIFPSTFFGFLSNNFSALLEFLRLARSDPHLPPDEGGLRLFEVDLFENASLPGKSMNISK